MPEETPPDLTYELLRAFERTPEGSRYATDSEKIKLLTLYILVRELAPNLTFEEFLRRFQPLADFDEENAKHPADAIKKHLPRGQRQAERTGRPQWTAREVVDILVLYTDMCRAADAEGVPVPLNLDEYLRLDAGPFKEGTIEKPKRILRTASRGGRRSASPGLADAETGVNLGGRQTPALQQPAILTLADQPGLQLRGLVTKAPREGESGGYSFMTEAGELYEGVAAEHLEAMTTPEAAHPTPEGEIVHVLYTHPPDAFNHLTRLLELNGPCAGVPLGEELGEITVPLGLAAKAAIRISNGADGPYIDSQLLAKDGRILAELHPRKKLAGRYRFETERTTYLLEVAPGE